MWVIVGQNSGYGHGLYSSSVSAMNSCRHYYDATWRRRGFVVILSLSHVLRRHYQHYRADGAFIEPIPFLLFLSRVYIVYNAVRVGAAFLPRSFSHPPLFHIFLPYKTSHSFIPNIAYQSTYGHVIPVISSTSNFFAIKLKHNFFVSTKI